MGGLIRVVGSTCDGGINTSALIEKVRATVTNGVGKIVSLPVGTSHILFGTDYNRFLLAQSALQLAGLKPPNDVRRGIERETAIKLFPRLA